MKNTSLKNLTVIAVFGALSFVLMYLSITIPIISPFASFDLSAVIELMGGFMLGPVGGIGIVALKVLLKLLFKGSESMLTGEIQNFILDASLVIIASLFYTKHKTKKGAVVGLVLGSLVSIVIAVFTNIYLIFPAYMKLYGMDWNSIIAAFSKVNPFIKDIPTAVAFSFIPFNVISRAITSTITVLLYKKVSRLIKGDLR